MSHFIICLVPSLDQGKTAWGNLIGKFFLNRRGFSVSVEDDVPLFVSLNRSHGFCLEARSANSTFFASRHPVLRVQDFFQVPKLHSYHETPCRYILHAQDFFQVPKLHSYHETPCSCTCYKPRIASKFPNCKCFWTFTSRHPALQAQDLLKSPQIADAIRHPVLLFFHDQDRRLRVLLPPRGQAQAELHRLRRGRPQAAAEEGRAGGKKKWFFPPPCSP